jgi:beta-lactamase regulating signal transducer with metallopeptidase domain
MVQDAEAVRALFVGVGAAFLGLAVKSSILFVLAFLGTKAARSLTPERRHTIWLVVLLLLTVLPPARLVLPPVHFPPLDVFQRPAPGIVRAVPVPPPASPELPRFPDAAVGSAARRTPGGGYPAAWLGLALAAVWASGALAAGARPLAGRIALVRLTRSPLACGGPGPFLDTLARRERVHPIRVTAHPHVTIPFAFGILRPTIMLPVAWPRWSRERLRAVLLHEIAHVKRRDAWWNAAAQAACAVAWFNPFAWVARALLLREAELSCDRDVLSHGVPRTAYASTIMAALRETRGSPLRPPLTALAKPRMMTERITRILFPPPVPRASVARRTRALVLAMCLVSPTLLVSLSFQGVDGLYGVWAVWQPPKAWYANQQTWREDGSGSLSLAALPDVPVSYCRFVIDRKWKDRGGYTWYHVRTRWSGSSFLLYSLIRLSPSQDRYEVTDSPLGYPDGFVGPPGDEKHVVYVRR